jgi:hypothetical protein
MIRIAVLDDYQNVSMEMADWSSLAGRADITVFNEEIFTIQTTQERNKALVLEAFETLFSGSLPRVD